MSNEEAEVKTSVVRLRSFSKLRLIILAGATALSAASLKAAEPPTNCVTAGLVSWWAAEGNAGDSVGTNHGILRNGTVFAAGKFGQGFLLDGADDFVLVPNSSSLFFTNGLTIELWFKNTRTPGGEPLFAKRNGGSASYGATLTGSGTQVYYNDPTVTGGDAPGSGFEISILPPPIPTANVFHHFAASYAQTTPNTLTVRTYIDGVLRRALAMPGNLANLVTEAPFVIGGEGESGAKFKGVIDEVGLFNRVLSDPEVSAIYDANFPGRCQDSVNPPPPSPTPPHLVGSNTVWRFLDTGVDQGSAWKELNFEDSSWISGRGEFGYGDGDEFTVISFGGDPNNKYPTYYFRHTLILTNPAEFSSVAMSLTYDDGAVVYVNGVEVHRVNIPAGPISFGTYASAGSEFSPEFVSIPANLFVAGTNVIAVEIHQADAVSSDVSFNLSLDAVFNSGTNCSLAGVVSWWPAEGNASDVVGTNNGTMRNGATFAAGKVGQGFWMDGTDDYVLVPDSSSLDLINGFTVQLWYKSERAGVGEPLIDKRNGASCNYGAIVSTQHGFQVFYNDPTVVDGDAPGGGVEISALPPPIPTTDVFHHFAATYGQIDSNQIQVVTYIDGVVRRIRTMSGNLTRTVNTAPLVFGSEAGGAGAKFRGVIDEVALFNRVLDTAEIQSIYQTASVGICNEGKPLLSTLANQTAERGSDVTFEIFAYGKSPFAYQWYFNENVLTDETNSVLTIEETQFSQAGSYFVVVTNEFGSTTSKVATLTVVNPPSRVRVVSVETSAAATVQLPIELAAIGIENAVSFSLTYNSTILSFAGIQAGGGLPENSSILINSNSTATGRVGISIALEPGTAIPEGAAELIRVQFDVATLQNPVVLPIQFGSDPVARQVADKDAHLLVGEFQSGSISITSVAFEADVAPRPGGDKTLNVIDWVQAGRFAAGLDSVQSNEFQRVDCAPRLTRGNGVISVGDWVQAGRYSAGLDPLTGVGGPTGPLEFAPAGGPSGPDCTVRIFNTNVLPGGTLSLPVVVSSSGIENALGFSINFDPSKLRYVGTAKMPVITSATLNDNDSLASSGKVGVAFALSTGGTLPPGTAGVVLVTFEALPTASGSTLISFADEPVIREAVSAAASTISSTFTGGEIKLGPATVDGPPLTIAGSVGSVALFWPASATGFDLYSSSAVVGGEWIKVAIAPIEIGGQKLVTVPTSSAQRFFRLEKH